MGSGSSTAWDQLQSECQIKGWVYVPYDESWRRYTVGLGATILRAKVSHGRVTVWADRGTAATLRGEDLDEETALRMADQALRDAGFQLEESHLEQLDRARGAMAAWDELGGPHGP